MDPIDFRSISKEDESQLRAACVEGLRSGDARRVFDAVQAIKWFRRDDDLLEVLMELLESPSKAMRGMALEGLGNLDHEGALGSLTLFVESRHDADEAAAAITAIGRVGNEATVLFLERVIWDEASFAMEVRERAVEALSDLASRKIETAVRVLEAAYASEELEPTLVDAGRAALRALGADEWDDRGFMTIDAELEPDN